mmetsp:Transcript_32342/g.71179  ORF Transcript_32342/g.71179 Transcript_32342/m.71179 type:complete len:169 (+) Transcript_32342:100-606(+)
MCGITRRKQSPPRRQFQQKPLKPKAEDIIASPISTPCCTSECDSPAGGKCDSPAGQLFLADVELPQVINSECDSPAVGDSQLQADFDLPRVITSSLRHISFNSLVGVVFIPCIAEYREAGLLDTLWWGRADFRRFKSAATSALKKLMRQHNLVDRKYAHKLFQSNDED